MPLCHWPCSCYPNHALSQTNDWMAEIYERWTAAHAVLIVTPVYWYQSPSPLKLMMDRLVCADGGNPDPTTTHGKNAAKAKALELKGWDYPQAPGRPRLRPGGARRRGRHRRRAARAVRLAGLDGPDRRRREARLDRYIGYYEPYATSHDALDADDALQDEVRNVARAVAKAVVELRAGRLQAVQPSLKRPRPK